MNDSNTYSNYEVLFKGYPKVLREFKDYKSYEEVTSGFVVRIFQVLEQTNGLHLLISYKTIRLITFL
jgi:hypothetical protein